MGAPRHPEPRVQGEHGGGGGPARFGLGGCGDGLCPPPFADPQFVCVFPPSQGEWRPRQIDNPDYKGKWVHPEIDNPEYSPDPHLYAYDSFGVIGLDLWQVGEGEGQRDPPPFSPPPLYPFFNPFPSFRR